MIIRRVVLLLVLALFASISIGVIVGLNSPARSGPDGTLVGSPSLAAPVAPSESVSPTQTAESKQTAGPKRSSTSKPTTKPKKSTASTKASTTSNNKTKKKDKNKKKSRNKKKGSRYLSGPLKEGSGGTVYLTFDDGPGTFTPKILKILSRSGSTATFFHLGVNERGFPKMDAQIRAQGSRVANHSYNHPDLTRLSASQLRWQLRHGPKAKCFRPPYGATNNTVRKAVGKAGMRQVLWDVDTLDWSKPGVATLAKTGRLRSIADGTIILMHDGGGDRTQTVVALPTMISDLQARGFKLRALPYC